MPKTPNPDPFHGDADKIEAFLMQLALKLTNNPDYEVEQEKKHLFFSLLKGWAFVWAKPYIHEQDNNVTIAQLTEKLKAAFDDPDLCTKAKAKLMKLHQGLWTYTKYLTETLALHADLTLDDEAKIMHFRWGLNSKIFHLLLTNLNLPKWFEEFTSLCMQLDNNVQAFKQNQWEELSYTKKLHLPSKQQQPYRYQYQKNSTVITG